MNKEEITKEDVLNITRSMFDTMLDYVDNSNNELEQLQQENKKYKEVIDKAINELFNLKNMIYKPETREENFEIQRKISSIIIDLNVKKVK